MNQHNTWTMGLDLGDVQTSFCLLDPAGNVAERGTLASSAEAFQRRFGRQESLRIALEVGPQSPWISRLLAKLGHEVLVANAQKVALIHGNHRKNDTNDAELLARLARTDPNLLHPLTHRSADAHADLAVIKSRKILVETRTRLINHVRGTLKSQGIHLKPCSTQSFPKLTNEIPIPFRPALEPLLEEIKTISVRIQQLDKEIERLVEEKYPETRLLQAIPCVGPVTALSFVLTIETPDRFSKSRDVGAYLGLVPRQDQSGGTDKQLGISKHGDPYLRTLLVQCAQLIIRKKSPECVLKKKGLQLASSGGKAGKRRAIVAVARRLGVLMHRLWSHGEVYDPQYGSKPPAVPASSPLKQSELKQPINDNRSTEKGQKPIVSKVGKKRAKNSLTGSERA